MKRYLISLLLGVPLTLAVLLFMATLVEPDLRARSASESRSIVIKMQEPDLQVATQERPVPPEPEPLPEVEPMPTMQSVSTPALEPVPMVAPPLDIAGVSPVTLAMPDVAPGAQDPAAFSGNFHGQQAGSPNGVVDGIGVSGLLTPLQRIEPIYPYRAQQAGIEGEVTLKFVVDPNGQVQDVTIVSANPRGQFERAAMQALRKWRYQARKGETGAIAQVVTLKFRLES
ncbi:energy transducer TonB [Aeromonas schubertii]|uniref:energy transducer TonB n=1 Tax=Aeromonas schubertii TaxID=652 RepID=UPI001CC6E88B|nr:energy transducer TonB [Aeromonas schubertii]MBZ6074657.1 TonB family protein [Aeromonas schubertii]